MVRDPAHSKIPLIGRGLTLQSSTQTGTKARLRRRQEADTAVHDALDVLLNDKVKRLCMASLTEHGAAVLHTEH